MRLVAHHRPRLAGRPTASCADLGLGERTAGRRDRRSSRAVEINTIGGDLLARRRPGPRRRGAPHPGLRPRHRRPRARGHARAAAAAAAGRASSGPSSGCGSWACRSRACWTATLDVDALGRPHVARALVRAGLPTSRRRRLRPLPRLRAARLRAAPGDRPARGDRGDPRRAGGLRRAGPFAGRARSAGA